MYRLHSTSNFPSFHSFNFSLNVYSCLQDNLQNFSFLVIDPQFKHGLFNLDSGPFLQFLRFLQFLLLYIPEHFLLQNLFLFEVLEPQFKQIL